MSGNFISLRGIVSAKEFFVSRSILNFDNNLALEFNNMSKKLTIPFILGGVISVIVFTVVGLSMGWVVTSGRAHASAMEMSRLAVRDQLVPICVHQFKARADSTSKLEKLRRLHEWERERFVEGERWATMPGSDSSVSGVARQCAVQLMEIAS